LSGAEPSSFTPTVCAIAGAAASIDNSVTQNLNFLILNNLPLLFFIVI
jgi:hypothetical protein